MTIHNLASLLKLIIKSIYGYRTLRNVDSRVTQRERSGSNEISANDYVSVFINTPQTNRNLKNQRLRARDNIIVSLRREEENLLFKIKEEVYKICSMASTSEEKKQGIDTKYSDLNGRIEGKAS